MVSSRVVIVEVNKGLVVLAEVVRDGLSGSVNQIRGGAVSGKLVSGRSISSS